MKKVTNHSVSRIQIVNNAGKLKIVLSNVQVTKLIFANKPTYAM